MYLQTNGTNVFAINAYGHIINNGSGASGSVVGSGLGSGGSVSATPGTDVTGQIILNTGTTSPSNGCDVQITYAHAYASIPNVVLEWGATGAPTSTYVSSQTGYFQICFSSGAALGTSALWGIFYYVIQ